MMRKRLSVKRIEKKMSSESKKLLSALKVNSCSVFQFDDTHGTVANLIAREPFGGNGISSIMNYEEVKLIKKVIQKKKPLCVKDPSKNEAEIMGIDLNGNPGSERILIIPLFGSKDLVSGLMVIDATNRDRLSKKEVRLSLSISVSISHLLARKRLLDLLGGIPNIYTTLGIELFEPTDRRRYRTF